MTRQSSITEAEAETELHSDRDMADRRITGSSCDPDRRETGLAMAERGGV